MKDCLKPFIDLAKIFKKHGFDLFLTGGSTRDYLLKIYFQDYDMVTDATPDEMKDFLPDWDYTFSKYGCVKKINKDINFEITTMREEGEYRDSRHPSYIKFVKDIKIDYKRRDFTINALYMDADFHIFDFCNGLEDLKHKKLVFIGNIVERIKEDPLRILRAKRFIKNLGLTMSSKDMKIVHKNEKLLTLINKNKIDEELSKFN